MYNAKSALLLELEPGSYKVIILILCFKLEYKVERCVFKNKMFKSLSNTFLKSKVHKFYKEEILFIELSILANYHLFVIFFSLSVATIQIFRLVVRRMVRVRISGCPRSAATLVLLRYWWPLRMTIRPALEPELILLTFSSTNTDKSEDTVIGHLSVN